jgi:hypothetical protein
MNALLLSQGTLFFLSFAKKKVVIMVLEIIQALN